MIRWLFLLLLTSNICVAQTHPYQDFSHDSKVFGHPKTYRIYLPEGYSQSAERYPVVYFFHGWGGRYYKDDNAKLEYELLGDLVNKYQVIMVMWDGNIEESEPRPYNIGNHEDVKYQLQLKDYFPELVGYIDSNYRTLADRDHRGIVGFSMGGFMSMFISGKYPDKVSAFTDMVGSPEFFVGYPDNHTLIPFRYLFDNLKDVSIRLQNMDNCPLAYMNDEVRKAAAWEGRADFEYWLGKGDHKVDDPGETKVFEMAMQFVVNRFHHPVALHKTWSHYDIYSDFDLWGYSVKSNKAEPGFLYLRNVTPAGFGFYSHKKLPNGAPIKNCMATVTTAPVYKKGSMYEVALYRQGVEKPVLLKEKADQEGRLHIALTGDGYEVSISDQSQSADFVVLDYRLDTGKRFIRVDGNNELSLTLLNRGGSAYSGKKVQLSVECNDPLVSLSNARQEIKIDKSGRIYRSQAIGISCTTTPPVDASPSGIKLNVEMRCGNEVFSDAITVPVFYDVPYFSNIAMDDGVTVKDKVIGTGNGNGQAEASEQIMLYENNHRLRLYTDDPYIETASEQLFDEVLPGFWADGITFSSIVKIADNCPPGHIIEFLANYETKTYMPMRRDVHWGKVKIIVK
jgi:pimeloyl-ACP methyl ester carboxylesterase